VKCHKCKVEYVEASCNYEQFGVIIPHTPCYRCPKCGDEVFSPEQVKAIREKISALAPKIRVVRKISKAGRRPVVYLPNIITETLDLEPGDEVAIYLEDGKRIILEPVPD
jgi:hypothetical protein